MTHRTSFVASAFGFASAVVLFAACSPPKWTVTRLDVSNSGTVVDVHGNTGLTALPAQCQMTTPAFPSLPDAWWNAQTAPSRVGGGVVGYVVWADFNPANAPPTCPASRRTDAYRGFWTFDLSRYANVAGTIAKAMLIIAPSTHVTPVAAASTQCDAQYGAAFELRRVPPAVTYNGGMNNINYISAIGGTALTNPPIPGGYPAGTLVVGFPSKNPALNPSLTQPIQVDITQQVVSTLQQGATKMTFMLTGVVEPTFTTNAAGVRTLVMPAAPLPQNDCRAIYRLYLDISTP